MVSGEIFEPISLEIVLHNWVFHMPRSFRQLILNVSFVDNSCLIFVSRTFMKACLAL